MISWNSCDAYSMRDWLVYTKYPLSKDEQSLVDRLTDSLGGCVASVYDLHSMNMLCFQALGYAQALGYVEKDK